MEFAKKDELLDILKRQNIVLDTMLAEQSRIHGCVADRNWTELERSINDMNIISDEFVKLDQIRESITEGRKDVYMLPDVEPVFFEIRTKLSKSKIENQALSEYVTLTQNFIDGVLEECVPQKRVTLYSPKGIVKPPVQSVVLNTLM